MGVTNTGNGERGTGNRERESGNECTAVILMRIQNSGRKHGNRVICSLLIKVNVYCYLIRLFLTLGCPLQYN